MLDKPDWFIYMLVGFIPRVDRCLWYLMFFGFFYNIYIQVWFLILLSLHCRWKWESIISGWVMVLQELFLTKFSKIQTMCADWIFSELITYSWKMLYMIWKCLSWGIFWKFNDKDFWFWWSQCKQFSNMLLAQCKKNL